MKKIVALLLSIMMLALAAAPALADEPYEVSIQFVGLFEENRNIANVEAALNEITLEKIGCTVDIVPVFIGNLPSTTSLGVAGDEKLDIVVAGLTSPLDTMVKDELLLPLDELLAEYGQDAAKATEHVAAAQKINGVTYAISGYSYAALAAGFVYNKTMAEQYGIDMHDFMTMDDLTKAGETLKEHGVYLTTVGSSDQCHYKFYHGGDYFGNSAMGGILDPAHSTTVQNVYATEEMRDFWKTMKLWTDSGYMPADQLTDTTTVQEYFMQQHIFGTASSFDPGQISSWLNPNFEVGVVQLTDAVISTGSVDEFMLGIASNCKNPEKAMQLINLIYADPEVNNLLQYGVEGTDYLPVEGSDKVITFTGSQNEDHNSYYAPFVRYGTKMNCKVTAPLTEQYYEDLQAFEDSAAVSLSLGYTFDNDGFGAEAGAIAAVMAEKLPMLNAGMVSDVDAAADEFVKALEKAGINDAVKANQEQLDAFLANK